MNRVGDKPFNGTKTHPLKPGSIDVLRRLASGTEPWQDINAGVRDRLEREGLAETVRLPSPYKAHKGGDCDHARITQAGRDRLAELDAADRVKGAR